ncbi:MAG: hypothetical protein LBV78_23515 [Kitasatospora sp.]|nr:hypothetical protein [Kitasatospora sp.]
MTTSQHTFRTHLQQAATGILERIPDRTKPDVYVLALNVWRPDADYRRPYVDVGYNTESRYEEEARKDGADPQEVRWNYAFWILDGFERLGNAPQDPVGGPLFEAEARALGLWYDGEPDLAQVLEDEELRTKSDRLDDRFRAEVVELARHLNASGTVERVFGRPRPVVVFDLDCPGWEQEATEDANPAELIEGFLAFTA